MGAQLLVSIPRSEFWSFGLHDIYPPACRQIRFNSSVGILVVRTPSNCVPRTSKRSFNSSVGILVVRTFLQFSLMV